MTWLQAMHTALGVLRVIRKMEEKKLPAFEIRRYIAWHLFNSGKKKR